MHLNDIIAKECSDIFGNTLIHFLAESKLTRLIPLCNGNMKPQLADH